MAAFGRAYPSHRNRLCRQLFWFSSPKCSLKPPGQKHNRNLEMLRSQLQPRTATASSSALPDQFVTVIMEKKHLNISLIALPWTQVLLSWLTELLQHPDQLLVSAGQLGGGSTGGTHARLFLAHGCWRWFPSGTAEEGELIVWARATSSFPDIYSKTGTNVCPKPSNNNSKANDSWWVQPLLPQVNNIRVIVGKLQAAQKLSHELWRRNPVNTHISLKPPPLQTSCKKIYQLGRSLNISQQFKITWIFLCY